MAFDLKNTFNFFKQEVGGTKHDRSIGIDIGSSAIKVVELKKSSNAIMLSTYGELQLGPYSGQSIGATVSLETEQMITALVDVIREAGVVAKQGVLSVPLAASFLTSVDIETDGDEDIAKMIPIEARKYIPIPLKEVALDWYELEQTPIAKKSDTRQVLLAAIQNESLAHYHKLQAAINMTGQPTEIEPFSVIRAVANDSEKTSLILDLGASMSKLYIVKGSTLQKLHRVKSGGEHISKRLSEQLDISFEEAEILKRAAITKPEHSGVLKNILHDVFERPLSEFSRVITQYQHTTETVFDTIYVVGGCAQLPQLSPFIEEKLTLPVKIFNPFSRVAYPAFMEDVLQNLGSSFTVATGAAMRPFFE